jgi:hypothetical protein
MAVEKMKRDDRQSTNWLAFILIGIGAIWLLGQLDIFRGASLAVLARYWPLIIVAIGLNLLLGRRNPGAARLVTLATAAVLVVLVLAGPTLGLAGSANAQRETFIAEIDSAEAAEVRLELSIGNTTITSLDDSDQLVNADLNYLGDIRFDVSGDETRRVTIAQQGENRFSFFDFSFFSEMDLSWNVSINPDVPLELTLGGGMGEVNADLSAFDLTALTIDGGMGTVRLTLPEADEPYAVDINGGMGTQIITVEDGAAFNMTVDGGMGSTILNLPEDTPIRIERDGGMGGVSFPNWLRQVSGDDNQGVWETSSYAEADESERITIDVDGGMGSLEVR